MRCANISTHPVVDIFLLHFDMTKSQHLPRHLKHVLRGLGKKS